MAEAGGMQLLGLSVTGPRSGAEDVILSSAMDLSQFSFFQRGTCVRPRRRPLRSPLLEAIGNDTRRRCPTAALPARCRPAPRRSAAR